MSGCFYKKKALCEQGFFLCVEWISRSSVGCFSNLDIDERAVLRAFDLEFDVTSLFCKKGVIFATTYVNTSMELGAALTNDDVACQYQFTAKTLDAQTFGMRIATVSCTTTCFLMS